MSNKISVLLVDDHSLVRRGFRRILEDERDITVVGEANDGAEAVRLAEQLHPQLIVMDCALPGMSGLDATRQILRKLPETAILMLSMHSEDTWVHQALDAGARGYILKSAVDMELVTAIRRVAAGEIVLDPQVSRGATLKGERSSGLTVRELEVLQADRRRQVEQGNCHRPRSQRQHGCRASRQYHGCAWNPQDRGTRGLRHSQRPGEHSVNRRSFLLGLAGAASASVLPLELLAGPAPEISPGFRLVDVTKSAGIQFQHNSGAYGGKLLPETLGSDAPSWTTTATAGRTSCWSTAWTGPATSGKLQRFSSTATIATVLSPT